MLLQVQLTLLQKNFEGGGTGPLGPPPRSAPAHTAYKSFNKFDTISQHFVIPTLTLYMMCIE